MPGWSVTKEAASLSMSYVTELSRSSSRRGSTSELYDRIISEILPTETLLISEDPYMAETWDTVGNGTDESASIFLTYYADEEERQDWGHVCWHTMRRTTVKLPDDVDAKLRHEASRRGTTIAEITREAIEAHLGGGGRRRLIAAKAGRSGRRDTARRIEEIIRREARR